MDVTNDDVAERLVALHLLAEMIMMARGWEGCGQRYSRERCDQRGFRLWPLARAERV